MVQHTEKNHKNSYKARELTNLLLSNMVLIPFLVRRLKITLCAHDYCHNVFNVHFAKNHNNKNNNNTDIIIKFSSRRYGVHRSIHWPSK